MKVCKVCELEKSDKSYRWPNSKTCMSCEELIKRDKKVTAKEIESNRIDLFNRFNTRQVKS